jgi:hypothetical protein
MVKMGFIDIIYHIKRLKRQVGFEETKKPPGKRR